MNNKVYEKSYYIIFKVRNGFIVYNTKKQFDEGHTHMRSFKASKTLIDLAIRKKIPRSNSEYYMTSLIRISNDEKFSKEISEIMKVKKQKTKYSYRNKNKVSKRKR